MQNESIELYRELVMLDGGECRTTSRHVASKFGKAHKTVLRNIDALRRAIESGGTILRHEMFTEADFVDSRGKVQRQYRMSETGFALLAMRFTGNAALTWQIKFVAAFEWLASIVMDRDENRRLIALFDVKNKASIDAGSCHGRGLRKRRTEIPELDAEEAQLKAKVQATLILDPE